MKSLDLFDIIAGLLGILTVLVLGGYACDRTPTVVQPVQIDSAAGVVDAVALPDAVSLAALPSAVTQ